MKFLLYIPIYQKIFYQKFFWWIKNKVFSFK